MNWIIVVGSEAPTLWQHSSRFTRTPLLSTVRSHMKMTHIMVLQLPLLPSSNSYSFPSFRYKAVLPWTYLPGTNFPELLPVPFSLPPALAHSAIQTIVIAHSVIRHPPPFRHGLRRGWLANPPRGNQFTIVQETGRHTERGIDIRGNGCGYRETHHFFYGLVDVCWDNFTNIASLCHIYVCILELPF